MNDRVYFIYDKNGNPSKKRFSIAEMKKMELQPTTYVCKKYGEPTMIKDMPELVEVIDWIPPTIMPLAGVTEWTPPVITFQGVEKEKNLNPIPANWMPPSQEATLTHYQFSSFGVRFLAHLIDCICITFITVVAQFTIMQLVRFDSGNEGLLLYSVPFLYYTLTEASKEQGTWGKRALGIKLVTTTGQNVSLGVAFIRCLGKIFSAFIFFAGFLMILITDKKQALHDKLVGTYVVNN